jgi:hypothetical protein
MDIRPAAYPRQCFDPQCNKVAYTIRTYVISVNIAHTKAQCAVSLSPYWPISYFAGLLNE